MQYNKQNPFMASIQSRSPLSKFGSQKNTQHLVMDIRGSGLSYQVGDSVGVFSKHDPHLVEKTLGAMKLEGNELVYCKQTSSEMTLVECLTSYSNITDLSPKFLREVWNRQSDAHKKHELEVLLQETHREELKAYLQKHEIWDFLETHHEASFSPQELVDLLMPLLPRFYSIASSQKYVGDEIHLTVAPLEYESNGHKRRGVCTHFLCELVQLHEQAVPIFIQPTHNFRLPQDHHSDLIMIGPGTGVAPFRAFLQERLLFANAGGKHWLFFGEKKRAYDFFYEEDWKEYAEKGHLRLELAFSRDQDYKIYVQDKMFEHGQELFKWLEGGAYLYVCGDASRMAKDVDAMLLKLIQEYGMLGHAESKEYVKRLRQQKRYLRDVY